VIGKGTVKCTKVLHAPFFPVNLLSINAIVLQLNCVFLFDIPKLIFRDKKTSRVLGTGT
jgi:hypothetical protein